MSQHTEEIEAALDEGLAPMPEDLISLRAEKLEIDRQIGVLEARKKEITGMFRDRLRGDGLKGYVLDGKTKATVTPLPLGKFETATFIAENPVLAARYTTVKKEADRTWRCDVKA